MEVPNFRGVPENFRATSARILRSAKVASSEVADRLTSSRLGRKVSSSELAHIVGSRMISQTPNLIIAGVLATLGASVLCSSEASETGVLNQRDITVYSGGTVRFAGRTLDETKAFKSPVSVYRDGGFLAAPERVGVLLDGTVLDTEVTIDGVRAVFACRKAPILNSKIVFDKETKCWVNEMYLTPNAQ